MDEKLIPALNSSLQLALPATISIDELKRELSIYINDLLQHDFIKLVSLLYHMDVSEAGLKDLLKQNTGEDAGKIIAGLMIERQLRKIKSRQESRRDSAISDEEAW